jgi:hypothetical protein
MRKRLAVLVVAIGALALLPQGAAQARTRTHAKHAAIPPACVQKDLGPVHLQVGYCP